jgi:hypothetical protein
MNETKANLLKSRKAVWLLSALCPTVIVVLVLVLAIPGSEFPEEAVIATLARFVEAMENKDFTVASTMMAWETTGLPPDKIKSYRESLERSGLLGGSSNPADTKEFIEAFKEALATMPEIVDDKHAELGHRHGKLKFVRRDGFWLIYDID